MAKFMAREELNVDKVYDEENKYNSSDNSTDLETKVKENLKDTETDEEDENKSEEPSGDNVADTSSDNDDDSDDTTDDLDVAVECYKIAISDLYPSLKLEDYDSGSTAILNKIKSGAVYLKDIGIEYGPTVLKALGTGLLVSITMALRGFIYATGFLVKTIDKAINSYSSFETKIAKLEQSLADIKKAKIIKVSTNEQYSSKTIIGHMLSGKHTPVDSISIYEKFLINCISKTASKVESTNEGIKLLIGQAISERVKLTPNLINEIDAQIGLKKASVMGYKPDSDLVETYSYPVPLPGNLIYLAYLPKVNLEETDIKEAYSNSAIFYGKDSSNISVVTKIDYATVEELTAILKTMSDICKWGKQHTVSLKSILSSRNGIKYSIKGFLNSLIKRATKNKDTDMLSKIIFLKLNFLDNCYIRSTDDTENITRKVLSNYLAYCQASLLELSKS